MTDNRKNYLWGMTPFELVGMVVFALGMTATTVLYAANVRENTKGIAENKKTITEVIPAQMNKLKNEMISEIKSSENRTSNRIDRLDERMTRNSEENRKILIQILKSK